MSRRRVAGLGVTYLGSYPPRECGIATFTRDVVTAVARLDPQLTSRVIAVSDGLHAYSYPASVTWEIDRDVVDSYDDAARVVNRSAAQIVNIQHEYGLFGGQRGSHIVQFLEAVRPPVVLTMHTVLPSPDTALLRLTRDLISLSAKVIVLSDAAVDILMRDYGIQRRQLRLIPHGVPDVAPVTQTKAKLALGLCNRTVLATCGLMSPGKGIESGIDAITQLRHKFPDILYLVVGETHPAVKARAGESYRAQLMNQVERLGLGRHVRFVNRYLSYDELVTHLLACDVYVVPYSNLTQVVSGTLAYALGCGRAIVSTPSIYATEVLGDGRGVLAGGRDATALASGIEPILRDPGYKSRLEQRAYEFGHTMIWPRVAHSYLDTFVTVLGRSMPAASDALVIPPGRASCEGHPE